MMHPDLASRYSSSISASETAPFRAAANSCTLSCLRKFFSRALYFSMASASYDHYHNRNAGKISSFDILRGCFRCTYSER